jgi:hypothetical protein
MELFNSSMDADMALVNAGRYEEGVNVLKEILETFAWEGEEDASVRGGIGECLERSGKKEEADRWFEDWLSERPKDPSCVNYYVMVLADRGDLEKAEKVLKDCLPDGLPAEERYEEIYMRAEEFYAAKGDEFEFTPEAIMINGVLEVGSWTDEFGYNYEYRIKDATFEIVKADELSEELKIWQALAASGVIADVYNMFDYVYFTCFWAEYTAEFGGFADYIYPDDVPNFLNGQFAAFMQEDYFDKLIAKVEEVDKTAFKDLIDSINSAKALRDMAMAELEEKDYSKVTEYTNAFHDGREQYKFNEVEKLRSAWNDTYGKFAKWLSNWEL